MSHDNLGSEQSLSANSATNRIDKCDNELHSVSRRSALKGLASGGGISLYSQIIEEKVEETKIVTATKGGEPLIVKSVPTKWWNQINKAERIQHELAKQYEDDPGIKDATLTVGEERIAGKRAGIVRVKIDPNEENNSKIPDSKDGVDIEVDEWNELTLTACNTDVDDPVRGGTQVDSVLSGKFSSCSRMVDGNYEYMLSAAHAFDACAGEAIGSKMYQPTEDDQYCGDVFIIDKSLDIALVDNSGNLSNGYSDIIDGVLEDVAGVVTESGLKDRLGSKVDKMGRTTCGGSATLDEVNQARSLDCASDVKKHIKTSHSVDGGDSGGIFFDTVTLAGEKHALVVGMITASLPDGAVGPAGYAIEDELTGYEFY